MYRNIKNGSIISYMRKEIIVIPSAVNVIIKDRCISIAGVLGNLVHTLHILVIAKIDNIDNILVYTKNESAMSKALVGTTKALIYGMIIGVTKGFSKKLQLIGIGYRASIENNMVNLVLGLSHTIQYKLPVEIQATCINQIEIVIKGINKQLVGQVAANLRSLRPPEPFKGKGIRYIDEVIRNKDTKKR